MERKEKKKKWVKMNINLIFVIWLDKKFTFLLLFLSSLLFFYFFIPNLGLFGRLEREREEINKGGKYNWNHMADCAITIIRKSKPGQVSQTADSYVDELFFFRSNCVKALIWFILKIIKAHTYIPNTSSYRLKHSTVKHSNPSLHNIDLKHLRIMFKSEDCIYYFFFSKFWMLNRPRFACI